MINTILQGIKMNKKILIISKSLLLINYIQDELKSKNFEIIAEKGVDYYLNQEKERFKCKECSGTINMHDRLCCNCGVVALSQNK